MSTYLREID